MSKTKSLPSLMAIILLAGVCVVSMTTPAYGFSVSLSSLSSYSSSVLLNGRPTTTTTTTTALSMSDDFIQETPEMTKERIEALVENHPVLLFMKGSKLFPQCGFSNTATQILTSYDIDFHTVDVLSDEAIRQGIKDFSQWVRFVLPCR